MAQRTGPFHAAQHSGPRPVASIVTRIQPPERDAGEGSQMQLMIAVACKLGLRSEQAEPVFGQFHGTMPPGHRRQFM